MCTVPRNAISHNKLIQAKALADTSVMWRESLLIDSWMFHTDRRTTTTIVFVEHGANFSRDSCNLDAKPEAKRHSKATSILKLFCRAVVNSLFSLPTISLFAISLHFVNEW